VLFEKGPEGLSQREFAAIKERRYQVVFPRNPAPGSLEVEGYCNESPVESENMRISRARARAFRDVLRDKLFAMWPDVQTRGYGSTPPLVGYYEYAWSDGWGPSSPQAQSRGATGSVGPPHKPALGDTPRGEIGVRLVVREPAKAATPAPPSQSQAASAALSAITTGLTSDPAHSERAFGSLLDLAPASASARRSAAAFLGRDAPVLSLDVLHEATALERDQSMMSRWALGMTLARAGKLDDAVDALASTLEAWLGVRSLLNGDMSDFRELERIFFPSPSTLDVLEQDLAVLGAAAAHDHPETKAKLEARLRPLGLELARRPSLRFVLTWESSADVDLEVEAGGKHWDPRASMDRDVFPGEGIVLADVRAFGPEAYVVNGAARAYPFRILARLHAASGDTFGRLDVVDYDGAGGVQVEEYPFVLRAEGETIEVATLRGALAARKKAPCESSASSWSFVPCARRRSLLPVLSRPRLPRARPRHAPVRASTRALRRTAGLPPTRASRPMRLSRSPPRPRPPSPPVRASATRPPKRSRRIRVPRTSSRREPPSFGRAEALFT
jgi:hypothetical protein